MGVGVAFVAGLGLDLNLDLGLVLGLGQSTILQIGGRGGERLRSSAPRAGA
jgi:hypothetical protein